MNIYFLAHKLGNNYLESKDQYSNLCNGNFHHIVYNYWILRNNLNNKKYKLFLVTDLPKDIRKNDVVIFHYDTKDKIDTSKYITVQVIGDFPEINNVDYIITHNPRVADNRTFFIHFPLPANIKKFNPIFPPTNFTGVGCQHSFSKEILNKEFIKNCSYYGINLQFITDKNYCDVPTDVFVFLRDKNLPYYKKENGEPLHPSAIWSPIAGYTHRHANRIYQAWYMNTPCILNNEATIEGIVKTKYDALFVQTPAELFTKMLLLKKDRELFENMINNCRQRANENSYKVIVEQYEEMFAAICR
jgi:hypothetical protein